MHYSDKPGMVRVDFFRDSMKWYTTEAVDMTEVYQHPDIFVAFKSVVIAHLDKTTPKFQKHRRLAGMHAICLEPYHRLSHPISFVVPERNDG